MAPNNTLLAVSFLRPLVSFLQIFSGFLEGAEGIVVGLQSLTIFVDGPFALAGDVENLAELDVAPDFSPARLAIPIQTFAVSIGRRLIIPLQEKDFGNSVVGQRAIFVEIERFVELQQRASQVALLLHGLSTQNGGAQLHVAGVGEHAMIWINGDAARTAESLNRKWRVCADHFHALIFGPSVGIDAQVYWHAEQVKILRNFAGDAESRRSVLLRLRFLGKIAAQTISGVLNLEFGRARGIEPLGEEPGELAAIVFLRNVAEIVGG